MATAQILIVEDEGIIALEIEARLIDLGYTVLGRAESGPLAIKMITQQRPDLVLMDIVLNDEMDGVEAAKYIQQQFAIPVIFLTAHADRNTLERAKVTEPFGYIVKPFTVRDLEISIEMGLYKHRMEEKLRQSEERLRLLVENSEDIVIMQDLAGKITYYHGGSRYGLERHEVVDETLVDFFPVELATHLARAARRVAETGLSETFENEIEWRGTIFWFNIYLYPIRNPAGQIQSIAIIARNVTEVKRLKGLLPICAWCGKKIRDENNEWQPLDQFLNSHTAATVTHSICDDCIFQAKS